VAAPRARAVRRLLHALLLRSTDESCPSAIGVITLDRKQAGERSAGNPHARFDEAGNRNQLTVRLLRHSQRKRRETARHTYGEWRHSSTLLLGEAMETSASFEARSAPLPYPTTGMKQRMLAGYPNVRRRHRTRSHPVTAGGTTESLRVAWICCVFTDTSKGCRTPKIVAVFASTDGQAISLRTKWL